mgnify:CR=1 FL=1
MAILSTPILSSIQTFDPSYIKLFDFYYTGNQIEKKRVIITKNDTFETVLDNTQFGMKLSYELAANTLSPGQYTIQIQVFDFDGNSSELSQPVLFYCFTKPELKFIDFNNRVNKANITVTISYSQLESDALKNYIYYLYDQNKSLIAESKVFYNSDNYTYTFYGIKNLSTYYIRCIGKTLHDFDADTGYCEFTTDYIIPPNNMFIQVENNMCEGYITIDCNIVDIGYRVDGEDPIFNGNSEVILDGSKVTYTSGYDLSDEFSIFIKARNIPINKTFFGYTTSTGNVSLSIQKIATEYYCVLEAESVFGNYYRYIKLPRAILLDTNGNSIIDTSFQQIIVPVKYDDSKVIPIIFELKRKDNLYNLKVYYEDEDVSVKI